MVLINDNEYKVVRRRWDIFTASRDDTKSLIGERMVPPTLQMNVYLK
jgi:hypothetical protein